MEYILHITVFHLSTIKSVGLFLLTQVKQVKKPKMFNDSDDDVYAYLQECDCLHILSPLLPKRNMDTE